jgi:hypothetical protein
MADRAALREGKDFFYEKKEAKNFYVLPLVRSGLGRHRATRGELKVFGFFF